jgi:ribosomal protein S18
MIPLLMIVMMMKKTKEKQKVTQPPPTAPGHVIHSNNHRMPQALLAKGNYNRSKKYKSGRSHKLGHRNIHKVNAHKQRNVTKEIRRSSDIPIPLFRAFSSHRSCGPTVFNGDKPFGAWVQFFVMLHCNVHVRVGAKYPKMPNAR